MQSKLKSDVHQFFQDKNGIDELGLLFFILGTVFTVLYIIFPKLYEFLFLFVACFGYCVFRILSKNLLARERENTFFVNLFHRKPHVRKQKVNKQKTVKVKKEKVKKEKNKTKDKNYIYMNCPSCGKELKISRAVKGKKRIMCTGCYNEIEVDVK